MTHLGNIHEILIIYKERVLFGLETGEVYILK